MKELGNGLRAELRDRFKAMERRFDVIVGALLTGFVGLVVNNLIG